MTVYTQCTVRINSLHVTNVYKPPAAELHQSSLTVLPHPAIYIGDFNAHHQDWGYEESDTNGEELVEWADRNSIHLVFDAKDRKAFFSRAHCQGYNPDLSFVSCDAEGVPLQSSRVVLPAFPRSQHRPVLLTIGLSVPVVHSVPRPRWNFRKADWETYRRRLDDSIRFIPPVCENYNRFVGLVIATAKKTIPRGYRKQFIPCWNEESDRLYEELKDSEDPETAKQLLQSLDDARRSRWCETVESLDFTHSSRR